MPMRKGDYRLAVENERTNKLFIVFRRGQEPDARQALGDGVAFLQYRVRDDFVARNIF